MRSSLRLAFFRDGVDVMDAAVAHLEDEDADQLPVAEGERAGLPVDRLRDDAACRVKRIPSASSISRDK